MDKSEVSSGSEGKGNKVNLIGFKVSSIVKLSFFSSISVLFLAFFKGPGTIFLNFHPFH